jgi:hypothetical protein
MDCSKDHQGVLDPKSPPPCAELEIESRMANVPEACVTFPRGLPVSSRSRPALEKS